MKKILLFVLISFSLMPVTIKVRHYIVSVTDGISLYKYEIYSYFSPIYYDRSYKFVSTNEKVLYTPIEKTIIEEK